jgi:hypothetical protein
MATLLRTLTKKSFLKFGQYYDLKVGDLLSKNTHRYLRWVYFNCDMINFTDDILDEIKIPKEFRINKPSKNPELYIELNELMNKKISWKTKNHYKKVSKISHKKQALSKLRKLNKLNSLNNLTLKNHGH